MQDSHISRGATAETPPSKINLNLSHISSAYRRGLGSYAPFGMRMSPTIACAKRQHTSGTANSQTQATPAGLDGLAGLQRLLDTGKLLTAAVSGLVHQLAHGLVHREQLPPKDDQEASSACWLHEPDNECSTGHQSLCYPCMPLDSPTSLPKPADLGKYCSVCGEYHTYSLERCEACCLTLCQLCFTMPDCPVDHKDSPHHYNYRDSDFEVD